MPITSYTRAPKETGLVESLNIDKQIDKYVGIQRQREEQERLEQKQREATYLQQAKVDPVFNMSSYWQQEQGKKIQEFQNFLAQKYYQTKNKPSLQDMIEIQNHKAALFEWQQQAQANQQKYAQAQKVIDSDPYGQKYDKEHFESRVNDWVSGKTNGSLSDDLLLPPKIKDVGGYLASKDYKKAYIENVTDQNGRRITKEVPITDQNQLKDIMSKDLFTDPKLYRTVTEEFHDLPKDQKEKYLYKQSKTGNYQQQNDNAILDYYFDKYNKDAFPERTKKVSPAPKDRTGGGANITGSVNYENPSDKITINIGKYKSGGKSNKVLGDVDVWGGYSLPGSITGVATARDYIDMETGKREKVEPGNDIIIKYPEIKYLPIAGDGGLAGKHTGYRDENGNLRSGYSIKAFLITRTEGGESKGLELTPELKDKLITKNPRLASQIEQIPLEVTPKGKQKPEEVTTKKQVLLTKNKVLSKSDVPVGSVLKKNKKTGEMVWFDKDGNKIGYGRQ